MTDLKIKPAPLAAESSKPLDIIPQFTEGLPAPNPDTIQKISSTKCFGPYQGAFRELTIDLVLVEGAEEPSWEISAPEVKKKYIPAVLRDPMDLDAGVEYLAKICAPAGIAAQSIGGKVMQHQDDRTLPREYLSRFNPATRSESIEHLDKLNLKIQMAEYPSVILLGTNDSGAKVTLHPARILYDNNTEFFGYVKRETFVIDNQYFFNETRLKPDETVNLIKSLFKS